VRIQAVLPGATATTSGRRPTAGRTSAEEIVMITGDMVDGRACGLDQGELFTIPALPDACRLAAYEAARQKLLPNLSRKTSGGALPRPRRGVTRPDQIANH